LTTGSAVRFGTMFLFLSFLHPAQPQNPPEVDAYFGRFFFCLLLRGHGMKAPWHEALVPVGLRYTGRIPVPLSGVVCLGFRYTGHIPVLRCFGSG
jgi:hypothetical protein